MANKYWQNKIRLKEAYQSGYESELNENYIRRLAKAAAEYFEVPKITLGKDLKDYLDSLGLLKKSSQGGRNIKIRKTPPHSLLGTNREIRNPFSKDPRTSKKFSDRIKQRYEISKLEVLPDPNLEQKYQDMLDASDVVGEVDLTNIPLTPENMELIRYILARKSGILNDPIPPSPHH